ncbi:MAG: hypothetical protein M5U32_04290 [Myxococcota bacterium]|nr:hypothetical protein [Myxococcota bacterium]
MAPLEVLVERLGLRLRFGWAFHAREVRFERVRESEAGPPPIATPLFAETFSFHVEHHDPLELHLQLEDLWSDPRRIGEGATRREAQEALSRLLAGVPAYLERLLDALEAAPLPAAASVRIHADLIALAREISGFLEEKKLTAQPSLRLAVLHLRKLVFRGSRVLVRERVTPAVLDAWLAGAAISTASRGASSRMLLQLIAVPQDARADALLLDLGARAFHEWLEDTCLDESNEAFEGEDSPVRDARARGAGRGGDRASRPPAPGRASLAVPAPARVARLPAPAAQARGLVPAPLRRAPRGRGDPPR